MRARAARSGALATLVSGALMVCFVPLALAGPPTHLREEALDVAGLTHPCGVGVDVKGDLYVSSAGESKIKVFGPSNHQVPIAEISNSHEPCGLAVNAGGEIFVSERATGDVVRYKPLTPAPTYGAAEPIDGSGGAKGIALDPVDGRLYVAEGAHVAVYNPDGSFDANVGEPELVDASGVAAYTSPSGDRYLSVADSRGLAADELLLFSGPTVAGLKLRREIDGAATPDGSLEFGPAGAYLAADPGNEAAGGSKCAPVGVQACTGGHLLVYDGGHEALDEFDASGEYLDQMKDPGFADAGPSGVAVDRSGGSGDGTVYLTAGSGTGGKALAFGPLRPPRRLALKGPLSHVLEAAPAVTTDSHGNVYAATGSVVHVFAPDGTEIKVGSKGKGVEDTNTTQLSDLAVDSKGDLYVLEGAETVTYYTPSAYPPSDGTTYSRHEPPVTTSADFPSGSKGLRGIAVNPGPGAGKDRLFVASIKLVREYDTAKNGSGVLNADFGGTLGLGIGRVSIAVQGASSRNGDRSIVYLATSGQALLGVNAVGNEVVARVNGAGCPVSPLPTNPKVAINQANGHVLVFERNAEFGLEYDGTGACVAEFGQFTHLTRGERIAVDSACATHVNATTGEEEPLDETTTPTCHQYDPADGNVYIAFDDTAPGSFDVSAFGPLTYGEVPSAVTGTPSEVGVGSATLNGTVNPSGSEIGECKFEYLEESQYLSNSKTFAGATVAPCAEGAVEIGEGTLPVPVHSTVGIDAAVHRCVRLVVTNAFGTGAGGAVCFGPPLLVEAESPHPIGYSEAKLLARIDPSGLPSTYRFEYGLADGEYEHSTTPQGLAAGAGASEVSSLLIGLAEGVEYHFRVVVENEAGTVEGPDQTFVALARRPFEPCPNAEYRTGFSAQLPDCRAYELVTPAQSNGLSLFAAGRASAPVAFDNWLTPPRGVDAGQSLAYYAGGTLPGFEGNGVLDGYRAVRGPGDHPSAGWNSHLFSPSYTQADPGLFQLVGSEGASPDQLYSIWGVDPEEPIAELAAGVYLRGPAGFEALGRGDLGEDPSAVGRHLSAGGTHVVFSSAAHLEDESPPVGTVAIYDRVAGSSHAEVVSVPPGGGAFGSGEGAAFVAADESGDAVVFSAAGKLYERRAGVTTEIADSPFTFAGISTDGKRVFYVGGVADGVGDIPAPLFACDAGVAPCAGPGAHAPMSIGPPGSKATFANVSADGSRAFFSTTEALTGSEENENGEVAEDGARNLYGFDLASGVTTFIGRLDPADFQSAAFGGIEHMNLRAWTAAVNPNPDGGRALAPSRSTADGGVLVFQSHARLTAYENEGVGEIYRYDPSAPAGEQLTCPSCDPSGGTAGADALLENLTGAVLDAHALIPNLTDGGSELFFSSDDRLLPEDVNAASDVYEWREKGSSWGGSPGAPSCGRPGGCLALISSGQGERDTYLYGMSADGHDVFLWTLERLVAVDGVGSISIYDAREGGGIPEAGAQAPCRGDACQGQGTPTPVLASPAGGATGNGNLSPEGKSRCPEGKHLVHRRGKAQCAVRRKRPHHGHRKNRVHRNRGGSR